MVRLACGGQLLILTALLISLCFSRGEGVHLLPFSCEPVTDSQSVEAADSPASFTSGIGTIRASAVKDLTKKNDLQNPDLLACQSFRLTARSVQATKYFLAAADALPLKKPTKFELTSASDRSPPLT